MDFAASWDIVSVGIAIAASVILGFIVFFSNRNSITAKTFLFFTLVSSIWGAVSYIEYQFGVAAVILWLLRIVLFFATWQAFLIFQLAYVFPYEKASFSNKYKYILSPIVILTSILTLTPYVFSGIANLQPAGQVSQVAVAPGIGIFAIVAIGLVIAAIYILFRKMTKATDPTEKTQFRLFFWGITIMFLAIIFLNFIAAAFLQNLTFVQLSSIFVLPFIILTSIAILRYHLLNVKVIATEILTFVLVVFTFFEVIFSQSTLEVVFRSVIFLVLLVVSVLLIRSVRKEVEQRELLEKLDKELEEKNKELNDLSRFKSELLSLASHQIRSPLAAIKGFASLILDGSYGPLTDNVKTAVEKMKKSSEELIGLINTLLDVRKVEEGKMEYVFTKTDLNKIVTDVVGLLQPLAEIKKLEFKFDSPGHEVWVNADGEKLKQVIQNLTDNAIKYTPAGFVHLELKEDAGTATVFVTDSGVGFSPELGPHLFEEFVRDDRVKKQILGTGLGLYIARKIAEAHGGTISAESPGEGKGSSFKMKVPEVK